MDVYEVACGLVKIRGNEAEEAILSDKTGMLEKLEIC